MKKILKYTFVILLIVLVCFLTNIIRNMIILNPLKEKIRDLGKIETFSYTIKSGDANQKITKIDNIIKIEKNEDNMVMYFNTATNEMIREDMTTGERTYYPGPNPASATLILLDLDYFDDFEVYIVNLITTKEINGVKCYKIKNPTLSMTYYVSAENGLTMAIVSEDKETGDTGNTTYYQYEFDHLEKIDFDALKVLAEEGETKVADFTEAPEYFYFQFLDYQKDRKGNEVVELLNKMILNASDNEEDNTKLPDIIYLDKNDSVKNSGLTNILDLTDEDINHVLEVEVYASNDGSFEFQYNRDNSFKIVSNTENPNQEAMSELSSQINLEDQYYVGFYYNWSNNEGLEAIIISHLN